MIQVKDLMIGDWVQVTDACTGKSTPCKITSIWENEYVALDGDTDAADLPTNLLEPIPLTPEILEKNGFKQVDKGGEICIRGEYVWGDKGKRNFTVIRITYYKGLSSGVNLLTKIETDCSHDSGINMVHSCDIEYVHELQHALWLCGIEHEITL